MEEQLTSVNHINVRVVLRSIFCNIQSDFYSNSGFQITFPFVPAISFSNARAFSNNLVEDTQIRNRDFPSHRMNPESLSHKPSHKWSQFLSIIYTNRHMKGFIESNRYEISKWKRRERKRRRRRRSKRRSTLGNEVEIDKSRRIERVARGVSRIICIIRVESFSAAR